MMMMMMMWNMCREGVTRWKAALSFKARTTFGLRITDASVGGKTNKHLDYNGSASNWSRENVTGLWKEKVYQSMKTLFQLWRECSLVFYFFVLLSQLFNLLQSESVVRSRTNRWQIPLKSSSNYSPKPSICPSVSTLYVQDCSSYMSEQQRAHIWPLLGSL